MSLKNITKEELETLSYADLAFMILKDNGKSMNTPKIFKKICEILEFTDEEYASKIGDFYTSLTTDKRFLLLDTAEWDLRDNHSINIVMDDDEEDEEVDDEDSDIEEENIDEVVDEETSEDIDVSVDDDIDDDIDDLAIVEEEELEED